MWLPEESDIPEELKMLQQLLRRFIKEEMLPFEAEVEAKGEVPPELRESLQRKMKGLGIYNMWAPREYGCADLNALGRCVVGEETGRISLGLGWVLGDCFLGTVAREMPPEATEYQRDRFFIPLVRGEKQTCVAFTEPGAGSDLAAIETTAVPKGDSYIVNGTKYLISNADKADFATVLVLTDREKRARGGMSTLIVEKGTPGFRLNALQDCMGFRGVSLGELVFQDCVVPAANLLGEEGAGFRRVARLLSKDRLTIGVAGVGVAARCLEASAQYAKQRVTFGQPVASRQAIQWMLADMAVDIFATRSMAYAAAREDDRGLDIRHKATIVKLYGTEMACRAADRAIQIHGGLGYTKDLPFEMLYRDWRLTRIGEGSSEVMKHLIARALLAD